MAIPDLKNEGAAGTGYSEEQLKEMGEFMEPWDQDMEEDNMSEEDMEPTESADEGDVVMMEDEKDGSKNTETTSAWLPTDKLMEGETLEHDESAYHMLHTINVEWPCLSFDFIKDKSGDKRTEFPMECYSVAGTQSAGNSQNKLIVMGMKNLQKTYKEQNEEDDDDSDDEMEEEPQLSFKYIKHEGCVNRIRSTEIAGKQVVSTWSDLGKINVFDISSTLGELGFNGAEGVSAPSKKAATVEPIYSFGGHPTEGFAMDWSARVPGRFVTGDCRKHVYLHNFDGVSSWTSDKVPFNGHESSVEDLQWSPSEDNIFASCSVDKTIKVWDCRNKGMAGVSVKAHDADVNVISWSKVVSYLMISGGDDGLFKIWDLRNFKSDQPAASYKWHTAPITSVEWHPTEDSVLAVAGADNQISLWDLSLENDEEAMKTLADEELSHIPPQLLFVHQGQEDIKELHWHPQQDGVIMSTAGSGYNIFKTVSV
eukprot:Nk52_evm17s239 gene=Nk52_evmTU17s239